MPTEKEIVNEINNRQVKLTEDRATWENDWRDISKLVNPRREFFEKWDWRKGTRIGKEVFDGTPNGALLLFASGMQGYTASPSIDWFRLLPKIRFLLQYKSIAEWYDACTEEMYYQLSISNFYNRLSMYFVDIGSIGTASMFIEWDYNRDKLCYTTYHPVEVYVEENKYGEVDTEHRLYKMTSKVAYEQFGDKLPKNIQESAKKNPYNEFKFIHAIYPNTDRFFGSPTNTNMPYRSIHTVYDTQSPILRQGGFEINPIIVWRWFKNDNEQYGRSPAHMAMVDIHKLNEINKDVLHGTHMMTEQVWMAPESMATEIRIKEGAINYYNKSFEAERIAPIYQGVDLNVPWQMIGDVREIIKTHFFVDFFLMISQADVQMTATEIIERQSEKATMLGPFVSIMNNEAYDNILDRTWQLMWENGKLPQPPDILYEFMNPGDSVFFDVEYLSPIAQAQKILFKSPKKALDTIIPYMQLFPEMRDWVNSDKLMERLADAHRYPKEALNDFTTVQEIRQVRAEQLKQQAQLEEAGKIAETAKDASKADTGRGNLLQEYLKQLGA